MYTDAIKCRREGFIHMSTLLSVSIAVLAGLLMTRVFNLWRLPDVTAYLVAGVLIGPYVLGSMHITGLGLVSAEAVSSLHLVSEVALGFIAFSIGNEFRLSQLKKKSVFQFRIHFKSMSQAHLFFRQPGQ